MIAEIHLGILQSTKDKYILEERVGLKFDIRSATLDIM